MKKYLDLIYSCIIIAIAAVSKALVDTIAFHNGGVFKGNAFFDITKQGKMFPLTKYPVDAFHLFNSLMILCYIVLAIINCKQKWWVQFIILSIVYLLTFNIFWNKILN